MLSTVGDLPADVAVCAEDAVCAEEPEVSEPIMRVASTTTAVAAASDRRRVTDYRLRGVSGLD